MIEGFDKEIDAILRQTRNGQTVLAETSPSAHLDADDLAAFAENALPDKTKQLYTRHLADCNRCRYILADIISLNSEAEIETASSAVVAVAEKTPENIVPWYRRMFVFPQLTYTMGFLVLIFSGFLAYLVLLNPSRNFDGSQLSQIEEKAPVMPGAVANANSMTTAANSAANFSNAAPASANASVGNNAPATGPVPNASLLPETALNKAAAPRIEPNEREKIITAKPPEKSTADDRQKATAPPPPAPAPAQPMISATRRAEAPKTDDKEKTSAQADENKTAEAETPNNYATDSVAGQSVKSAPAAKPTAKKLASETRQSGGRTFTRKNGVWYDANYNNQPTINISRGSNEYQKLDGGLRSIAQSLSGTLVVVSQGKAYRIQ